MSQQLRPIFLLMQQYTSNYKTLPGVNLILTKTGIIKAIPDVQTNGLSHVLVLCCLRAVSKIMSKKNSILCVSEPENADFLHIFTLTRILNFMLY